MRCKAIPWSAASLILTLAPAAHAFGQPYHYQTTLDACHAEGLQIDFCHATAAGAWNTDMNEFWTMSAHAESEWNDTTSRQQNLCAAGTQVYRRINTLGDELRQALQARGNGMPAATALGRAMHTIQDSCAHRGMSNPEHAWYSVRDACEGTNCESKCEVDDLPCLEECTKYASEGEDVMDPDYRPLSLACGRDATARAFRVFAASLDEMGIADAPRATVTVNPCQGADTLCEQVELGASESDQRQWRFTAGWDVKCHYADLYRWNGASKTWDPEKMKPLLEQALAKGLRGEVVEESDGDGWEKDYVCGATSLEDADETALFPAAPWPNMTERLPIDGTCGAKTLAEGGLLMGCVSPPTDANKADSENWEEDEPPAVAAAETGGCRLGTPRTGSPWGLGVVAGALLVVLRRRRSRAHR